MSSATNMVMVFALAGVSDAVSFGYAMLAYAGFSFLLKATRQFFGVPISLASSSPDEVRLEAGSSVILLLIATPVIAGVVAAGPLIAGAGSMPMLVAFALSVSVALAQDAMRFSLAAQRRHGTLLASDLIWLGVVLVALARRTSIQANPEIIPLLWGLGAIASMLYMARHACSFVSLGEAWQRIAGSSSTRLQLAGAAAATGASTTVAATTIATSAGPAVAGALAAAGQLMGPVSLFAALFGLVVLPATARSSTSEARASFSLATTAITCLCLVWLLVLLALPETLGVALLGDTWQSARSVLPIVGVSVVFVIVGTGGGTLLIRLDKTRSLLWARVAQATARLPVVAWIAFSIGTARELALAELVMTASLALAIWVMAWRRTMES